MHYAHHDRNWLADRHLLPVWSAANWMSCWPTTPLRPLVYEVKYNINWKQNMKNDNRDSVHHFFSKITLKSRMICAGKWQTTMRNHTHTHNSATNLLSHPINKAINNETKLKRNEMQLNEKMHDTKMIRQLPQSAWGTNTKVNTTRKKTNSTIGATETASALASYRKMNAQ